MKRITEVNWSEVFFTETSDDVEGLMRYESYFDRTDSKKKVDLVFRKIRDEGFDVISMDLTNLTCEEFRLKVLEGYSKYLTDCVHSVEDLLEDNVTKVGELRQIGLEEIMGQLFGEDDTKSDDSDKDECSDIEFKYKF